MLGVSKPGALSCNTLFRLIPFPLFVFRNPTLIYLPLSGSLDSLLCDPMALTPDPVFFLLMSQTLAAASSFSSSRAYSSELSTSSLSLLGPYSDYVEVNISLNDSSLSFLNVYALSFRSSPKNIRTNFFSLSILPFYVEAEAVEFSRFRVRFRFRLHRKRTASIAFASSFRFRLHIPGSNHSNFNYKPQVESRQQHLALCMDRHLRSVAIMIEVTSRHLECTHFYSDCSQMPAVAKQLHSTANTV